MCKAFSCIIGQDKKVTWKFGTDSHEDLIRKAGYTDDTLNPVKLQFCRIEISPKNGSYLAPDKWCFKIDMDVTPAWWTEDHEKKCWLAFQKWSKQLDAVLVRKPIIHPFRDILPPEITEDHIRLVKDWASVGASVGASVRDSVWASVGASVWAYVGGFFLLPRSAWKYTDNIKTEEYPFRCLVTLWEQGLVPSFDGKKWRLLGREDARILWESS